MKKILFIVFTTFLVSASHALENAYNLKDLGIIAKITVNIFAKDHFSQIPFDDALSSKFFDEYFKTLDPGKMYFTKADIQAFESERLKLDDQLKKGDVSFAYKVYDKFMERVRQCADYSIEAIKKGFDFSLDEEFELDRTKLPWPENEDELRKIWYLKAKNDVLYYRLIERAQNEESLKKEKDQPDETKKKSAWKNLPPEERVIKRLANGVTERAENDQMDILGLFLSAFANIYDPHSCYMPPKEEEDFNINMSLSLVGIGATLQSVDGYTKVVSLVPGGPAANDGRLEPEDRIVAVAQGDEEPVDVIDMPLSKVVRLIRGKEKTVVRLFVLKSYKGMGAVPEEIALVRDKVQLKQQEAKGEIKETKRNGCNYKIGTIILPSFYYDFEGALKGDKNYKSSTKDVKAILQDFSTKAIDGLVIDMRSNGGGSLPEAISISGLFMKAGPMVQVKDSSGSIEVKFDPDKNVVYDGPLLVLVNRLSASATEIFAAAIQDYGRGIIVGDQHTHGKGTVQTIMGLQEMTSYYNLSTKPGSVRITTQKFYRINGESTQIKGVTPDIIFPSFTDCMDIGEVFLEHALPWDTIPAVKYERCDKISGILNELKQKSEKRRNESADFKLLLKDIERFDRIRKNKKISLNEAKRWTEYLDEKKLLEQQETLMKLEEGDSETKDKKTEKKDIFLDEAVNILSDMIFISASKSLPEAVNQ